MVAVELLCRCSAALCSIDSGAVEVPMVSVQTELVSPGATERSTRLHFFANRGMLVIWERFFNIHLHVKLKAM